jgi:hypothetical protein
VLPKNFSLSDYTPACPALGRDRGRQAGISKKIPQISGISEIFQKSQLMIKLKKGFVKQNLAILVL